MDDFNPKMLVCAREARALTQLDLAARIGIAQGTISKVENGVSVATPEIVANYARSLNFPVDFFRQKDPPGGLPVTFHRKRLKLATAEVKQLAAQSTILRLQLGHLLRSVVAPPQKIPEIDLAKYGGSVADVARDLRSHWMIPRGPIANVTRIIEGLGVLVHVSPLVIDGFSFNAGSDGLPPLIAVTDTSPGCRHRFTLAHELGHVIFHHHLPLPGLDVEIEADEFAAEFLMPAAEIRSHLRRLTIDSLASLKRYWGTSMAAILKHAQRLDAISDSQAAKLWATMGRLGYRKREPVETPREQPYLVRQLAAFHMRELGYSDADLAAALFVDADEFRRAYIGSASQAGLRIVK